MEYTYKVRRKIDGKCVRNSSALWAIFDKRGWGVGQVYSEKSFDSVKKLYNRAGGSGYEPGPNHYKEIELVKFDQQGEVVVWTDTRCILSDEDAKKMVPNSHLNPRQLQAGIRDEIGPLLDKFDEAEESFSAGNKFNYDELYASADLKEYKLRAALDELVIRRENLGNKISNMIDGISDSK